MEFFKFLKLKKAKKRLVCIDFGRSFIKIACLEKSGADYTLLAYALREFQVSRKTPEEITACLKQALIDNSITDKEAYLSISDPEHVFVKKFSLPQMPKADLLDAVKWQFKAELPFGLDESVSDLQVVREYADAENAKKAELFCVFAKKELVNKYISILTACGLEPARISSSVFNYCGILNSMPDSPRMSATFDIGHSHSNLAIYQENKLSFIRSLNFSTSLLAVSLAGPLVTGNAGAETIPEMSRQLIQQYGIPLDQSGGLQTDVKAKQIISFIRPLLEAVVKEIADSFEYFKSESGLDIPQILYIAGGGANLRGLGTYLAAQLGLKVIKMPLAGSVGIGNIDPGRFSLDASQLSTVLGLGLSGPGINLLPYEIKRRKSELIQKISLRIAAISIGAVFIFSWGIINLQAANYKKKLRISKAYLNSIEEVKLLKETVVLKEALINKIYAGKLPCGGLLKLIGAVIPADMLLDEFNFNQEGQSLYLKGVISAAKDSVEKVLADFINGLEGSKFISEANLVNSKEADGLNTFEIKCSLVK